MCNNPAPVVCSAFQLSPELLVAFVSSDTGLVSHLMTAFTTTALTTVRHQYWAANLYTTSKTPAVRAVQAPMEYWSKHIV